MITAFAPPKVTTTRPIPSTWLLFQVQIAGSPSHKIERELGKGGSGKYMLGAGFMHRYAADFSLSILSNGFVLLIFALNFFSRRQYTLTQESSRWTKLSQVKDYSLVSNYYLNDF